MNSVDSAACPVVSITPEVVKAAYTKEGDIFAENGMQYVAPSLDMANWPLFEVEMYECFHDILKLTPEENKEAIGIALEAWREYFEVGLRKQAREVLDKLEEEGRVGVVMLGRPYHNDPGLNHEIMLEIQRNGYPIFSVDSLPQDEDILERLFGEDVRAGIITHPMDITDVWKNCYSENSSKKGWAAKYVARHPNLVAIDLSSFKCGHDAPMYNVIENIIEASGTPYFTFHDIDENKPSGSIKIRVETIDYFLKRYQEHLQRQKNSEDEFDQMVDAYRAHLERVSAKAAAKAAEVEADGPRQIQRQQPTAPMGATSIRQTARVPRRTIGRSAPPSSSRRCRRTGEALIERRRSGTHCCRLATGPMATARAATGPTATVTQSSMTRARTTRYAPRTRPTSSPEDQAASASASCNLPTKDYSKKAYSQLSQFKGKPSADKGPALNGKLIPLLTVEQVLEAASEEKEPAAQG